MTIDPFSLGVAGATVPDGRLEGEVRMPSITGGHHIALTVTNADRSAEWYGGLLGMSVVLADDDETVKVRVLADPESGWVLGLRENLGREVDGLDEFRVGLDHFAFNVESRAALEEWEQELSARGIAYSPIAETPIGFVIVFRDPDNIQLEFWLATI